MALKKKKPTKTQGIAFPFCCPLVAVEIHRGSLSTWALGRDRVGGCFTLVTLNAKHAKHPEHILFTNYTHVQCTNYPVSLTAALNQAPPCWGSNRTCAGSLFEYDFRLRYFFLFVSSNAAAFSCADLHVH